MTLDDGSRALSRVERFAVLLFTGFAALIIVPALALTVIAVASTGAIDLGH